MANNSIDASPDSQLVRFHGLLLTLNKGMLLVPQSAITEVINLAELSLSSTRAGHGVHGWFRWRSLELPLISFETLCLDERAPLTRDSKIVICNTLGEAVRPGFYGLALQGFPSPIHIDADERTRLQGVTSKRDGLSWEARVDSVEALVPDFDFIESFVAGLENPA